MKIKQSYSVCFSLVVQLTSFIFVKTKETGSHLPPAEKSTVQIHDCFYRTFDSLKFYKNANSLLGNHIRYFVDHHGHHFTVLRIAFVFDFGLEFTVHIARSHHILELIKKDRMSTTLAMSTGENK